MGIIVAFLDFCITVLIKINRRVLNVLSKIRQNLTAQKYNKSVQRARVAGSTKYDMVTSPDEPYYREQYWHWIKKYLVQENLPENGHYLDIGCGQGRLTLPLAGFASRGKVTAIDISERAIVQAQKYAADAKTRNIEFIKGDISALLENFSENSLEAALFLEVSFFMPEFKEVLKKAKRILKPGGLLFASLRPQYFNALMAIKGNYFNDIDIILKNNQGKLFNSGTVFTWQTSGQMRDIAEKELGFKVLGLHGIGVCSGIEGDPHALVARPSLLDKDGQRMLMELETALAQSVPDGGRYILCVLQK